jgi:hypothetical protein
MRPPKEFVALKGISAFEKIRHVYEKNITFSSKEATATVR